MLILSIFPLTGLKAAEAFITRYSDNLEEHDLSPLLDFYPFMEFLTEKFGTKPVFLNSGTCALVDYIKQAPQQEMRLFIWSLENNVEMFPSLKHILNEYFEVMGECLNSWRMELYYMSVDAHYFSVHNSN